MKALVAAAALVAAVLFGWGIWIDGTVPLAQGPLHAGLHLASLGGAVLGALAFRRFTESEVGLPWALLATLVGWRLAYFPIMVFSGHVASIVEWLLVLTGLPILVYPFFLLSVAVIHAAAAAGANALLDPPLPWLRYALVPAFLVATAVSFNQLGDITILPDTFTSLEEEIPPMQAEEGNPYLPALTGPGYLPNQRIVLVAAGLTYETIPPSPWATTVKAVLEGLFHAKPFGSTRDRVLEHYLAYHAAHGQIGCRDLADCPPGTP